MYLTHNSKIPLYVNRSYTSIKKSLTAEYEHVVSSQKVKCDL